MKSILVFVFSVLLMSAFAQNGKIRGTVIDNSNGEQLIGANIVVKGTTIGTTTDIDGAFSLDLRPGLYDLEVSFIAYQTLVVRDVKVVPGEVNVLTGIRLKVSNLELGEVVVQSEAIKTSEAALISIKKKSVSIMDGVSASKMALIGDGTAVEASKRITGVSIEDGKYVYIRGLGDRYTKVTLNDMQIPGLDPDKNSLQMDIFPTNLIDNITVKKNFSAELPADFTGGIVNVETKAFPERKIFDVSIGLAYNPDMHFNPDHLTYKGGKLDFLGFDDGTRALPDGARSSNIPTPISGASTEEVNSFVRSFNPELGAKRRTSFMDYSASFSIGDQIDLKSWGDDGNRSFSDKKLGYIFSLSYKKESRYYDDRVYGEYQRYYDPTKTEMRYATIRDGQLGEESVLVGALGGLAYKTQRSKYRLTAMHLQSGISGAGKFDIVNDGEAVGQSGYRASSDNLLYNQRSMTNLLLHGDHFLSSDWELDWRISPTLSTSKDPDLRTTAFTFTPVDTLFMAGAGGNPSRSWRSLDEVNLTAKADATKSYEFINNDAKLKFGISHNYKQRDYEILSYDIQFFGSQYWPNPVASEVLKPENIYPNKPNTIYYQSGNKFPNPNAYSSNVHNSGVYVSNELTFFTRFRAILGLRAEYFVQRHTGRDIKFASGDTLNGHNLDNDKVLEALDLFPSVNLIFAVSENQNIRATYGRTIARPSFKEASFAQIIDPISNRIFNGGLFPYPDWDGNLRETRIDNLDLRWELFLERDEIISVSTFYKKFDDPIELVRIPAQTASTEYQPRNVGDGTVIGVEFEARKNLGFISSDLSNFLLSGNLTFVNSRIRMTNLEFEARKNFEREGESIKNYRQMAGQAPYIVNGGLSYIDAESGISAGAFYNVKGPTLYIVGAGLFPDVYNEPFHSLNVSFNKKLGENKRTTIDFKISNILNDKVETLFHSYEADPKPFETYSPGITFSAGVSYKL